ncbi:MAG: SDR family NAD(P)-dependent oxidoreductase [Bacteroidota bacterium]
MKNLLVTGASGNLGKVVVQHMIVAGHTVYTTHSPGSVNRIPGTIPFEVDLSDESDSARMVGSVLEAAGHIDGALLLAGGYTGGGVEAANLHSISDMLRMNAWTAWNVARPLWLAMKERGHGRIIFIGAKPALDPIMGKDHVAYAVSKSLLFSFTDLLNADSGEADLACGILVPGTIDTPANREWNPAADRSGWVTPETMASEMMRILLAPKQAASGRINL